jgi:serine/threonine protein kinase
MTTNKGYSSLTPPFPEAGSTIGADNDYFCLGRLGKGTFCSIHKCVDLSYSHRRASAAAAATTTATTNNSPPKQRIVAAKAELASFLDSGVIDGEASVLRFLDATLPTGMVPSFVDYVRQPGTTAQNNNSSVDVSVAAASAQFATSAPQAPEAGGISAIIMEYLPGEDMHLLRDRHCQIIKETEKAENNGEKIPRRLSVEDAVYLVADVMLPLLKAMHEVGMVHRDVKPSVSYHYWNAANEDQNYSRITPREQTPDNFILP